MKCRQAEQWMDAALDAAMAREAGEPGAAELLPQRWRPQLEAHLERCARCRRLWTQLGAAHAALRVPRPVPAPAGMLSEFHRRAAGAQPPAAVRPRAQPWLWIWPLASAAAGAAAAWMIAAHVAPLPAQTPLEHVARSSVSPPTAVPETPPPAVNDSAAPSSHPPAAAPKSVAGGVPKRSTSPSVARAGAGAPNRLRFGRGRGYVDFDAKPRANRLAGPSAPRVATNSLGVRLQDTDQVVKERLARRPEAPVMVRRVAEAENQPVALNAQPGANFYYRRDVNAVQSSEQDPPELRVSPAVLTALQRTVEPARATTSVQQAAEALAQAADISLEVDPRVAHRTVTLTENGVPLWKALEVVAEQSQAQVVPVRDHLVLKPLPAPPGASRIAGNMRLEKAPAGPAAAASGATAAPAAPAPAGAAKPLGSTNAPAAAAPLPSVQAKAATAPTEPRQVKRAPAAVGKAGSVSALGQRAARTRGMDNTAKQDNTPVQQYSVLSAAPAPDRKVWGEAWGTLPERGFAVPSPEEIPPQTLGLDAAKNTEPALRQAAPGQQQPLNNNVLRRNRQQNSR